MVNGSVDAAYSSWFSAGRSRSLISAIISQADCVQRGADPRIMTSSRYADHLIALRYCNRCPIKDKCLELVNPVASKFDGTTGGLLYNNGRNVTRHINDKRFKSYFTYKHANYTSIRLVRRAIFGQIPPQSLNHYERMLYIFLRAEHGVPLAELKSQFKISLLAIRYILIAVERDLPEDIRVKAMNWQAPSSIGSRAPADALLVVTSRAM